MQKGSNQVLNTEEHQLVLLLVDDDPNTLAALRRVFRPCGYHVLCAERGEQGLALLEQQPVDVVISDMCMPGMNGTQFMEAVAGRWPDTVRIILTGYARHGDALEAIRRGGIYRYLLKPWQDSELLVAVSSGLDARRQWRYSSSRPALVRRSAARNLLTA